jgi:hypothetical protein
MTNSEIAHENRPVLRGDLDDCENALNSKDIDRAKNELDSAITKLKRLASSVE